MLALTAAGLLVGAAFVVAATAAAAGHGGESLTHSCTPVDRAFIRTAGVNVENVASLGRDYLADEAKAKDVVAEAGRAARRVEATKPTDPTLARVRLLIGAMLAEYGHAVEAREAGADAAPHMVRSYGLANFAHELLLEAEPELRERGCDISGLM